MIPRLNYDIILQLPGKENKKKENVLINVDFMEFLSTQRLYTLNDRKKFVNTEDYTIIGEMNHFLRDQLEKLKHNTSYKYLAKALRPKIVTLKLLLTELMSNYEASIFKSSRGYSIPDVPNHSNYDRSADQYNDYRRVRHSGRLVLNSRQPFLQKEVRHVKL